MRRAYFALAVVFGAFAAMPAHAAGLLQDLFSTPDRSAPVVYHYAPAQQQMRFILDDGLRVSRRPQAASKQTLQARKIAEQRRIARKKAAALRLKLKSGHSPALAIARLPAGAAKAMAAAAASVKSIPAARIGSMQPAMCCKHGEDPSKLIHKDTTLRVGDAYMTPQGLRIYRGRNAAQTAAFVDYRKAEIANDMKSRFAALEHRRVRGAMPTAVGAPVRTPVAVAAKPVQSGAAVQRQPAAAAPAARTALDPAGRVIRVVGP